MNAKRVTIDDVKQHLTAEECAELDRALAADGDDLGKADAENLEDWMARAFIWDASPQGFNYWEPIIERLSAIDSGEPPPHPLAAACESLGESAERVATAAERVADVAEPQPAAEPHSPEPWLSFDHGDGDICVHLNQPREHLGASAQACVAVLDGRGNWAWLNADRRAADARRIVACVNACKGVPTEQLENDQAWFIRRGTGSPFEIIRDLEQQLATARAEAKVNGEEAATLRAQLGDAHRQIGGLRAERDALAAALRQMLADAHEYGYEEISTANPIVKGIPMALAALASLTP